MIQTALKEITRRKGRAMVTIAGYSIAVLLLILFISLMKQTEKNSRTVLTNTGTHFIAFRPKCCDIPFVTSEYQNIFVANGIQSQLMSLDLIKKIEKSPAVKDASPFLMFKFADKDEETVIGGLEAENTLSVANSSCAASDIVSGRFLKTTDTTGVMLEQAYALYRAIKVGEKMTFAGVKYEVVGIVNPGIRPAKADVYIPIQSAESLLRRWLRVPIFDNLMNIVLVESANAYVHGEAMAAVTELVGKESLISSYGCYKPASKAMAIHQNSLKLFILMTLLFVISIALNSQLAALMERKRDIGIFQAIGWSSRRILGLIFTETFLQALIGIVVGAVLSLILWLTPLFSSFGFQTHASALLDWTIWGFSSLPIFLGAAIAGLGTGIFLLRKEAFYNLYRTS